MNLSLSRTPNRRFAFVRLAFVLFHPAARDGKPTAQDRGHPGCALRFLQSRPEVDGQRIGGPGICASAAYKAEAAATNPLLRSVALVAPWLHDRRIVEPAYGGAQRVRALIQAGRAAQARFEATGQATLLPAASTTDKSAVMFNVP